MDELTNHVLVLLAEGKITKEAAVEALSLNPKGVIKLAKDFAPRADDKGSKGFLGTVGEEATRYLLGKVFGGIEGAMDKGFSGMFNNKDAVFQKMMRQHPSLVGKDPARAKANFNYIVSTSPHLLKHPLILGDTVANMTAMGSTALPTLNELAELQKNLRVDKKPSEFSTDASKNIARALFPNEPDWKSKDPEEVGRERADEAKWNQKVRETTDSINPPPPPPAPEPEPDATTVLSDKLDSILNDIKMRNTARSSIPTLGKARGLDQPSIDEAMKMYEGTLQK